MSQPWRPSRGSGQSRWGSSAGRDAATGLATAPRTPHGQGQGTSATSARTSSAPIDTSIVNHGGFKQAKLRPLRENKMDFSSPSRGELVPGRSLTDQSAQGDLRAHLEDRVRIYQADFPDELGIIIHDNAKQKDALDLILLEFRKLREGIVSSGRRDAFAVEVYETSAKLAILANNTPQISTILPHLVKTLHWPVASSTRKKEVSMESAMQKLDLNFLPSIAIGTRARYASYHMLHLICKANDMCAFQDLVKDIVYFGGPDSGEPARSSGRRSSERIPADDPTIVFAFHVLRCRMTNNYAALAKILNKPQAYDKFAWILVRSTQAAFRASSWSVMKSSYISIQNRDWLSNQLLLDSTQSLDEHLTREGLTGRTDASGAIVLKQR